jgi:hypothetical protein
MMRLGLSGHSQGGCLVATYTTKPNVKIVIPLSASTPARASSSLKSVMYLGGMSDTVIGYNASLTGNFVCPVGSTSDTGAYTASPGAPAVTKRLVGITGGGHLVPTDLCQDNSAGRTSLEQGLADGVCGISTAVLGQLISLFDCGTIGLEDGLKAVNYATTAALEETLQCKDRSAAFTNMQTAVPKIGDFRHEP